MNVLDRAFLRKAFLQARQAQKKGEVPVGAILVHGGRIIARAYNLKETKQDATAHAEMLALKKAMKVLNTWHLDGATLYSTLEPCPMCAGAILHSRLKRVVFGAWDHKWGGMGSVVNLIDPQQFNHVLEATYLQSSECSVILTEFFRKIRINKRVMIDSCDA